MVHDRLGSTPDEMDGGHLPALGRPRELVDRLERYRTGTGEEGIRSENNRTARGSVVIGKALFAGTLLLGLSACNPLLSDPVSIGGELEQTAAKYTGPAGSWLEVAVSGAPDHAVYAFALIRNADLHGPTARSCAGATVVACDVTASDVRMPNQRLVAGDGSQSVRLMTVWSGETVQIVLVCVDQTQELGCPATVRTILTAVDADGIRVGDLVPGTVAN